jgi:hypothetical protein
VSRQWGCILRRFRLCGRACGARPGRCRGLAVES